MEKLCRQVSIESPGPTLTKECVFNFNVPVPSEVPPLGALIKVAYAGACYRLRRSSSVTSITSISSVNSEISQDLNTVPTQSPAHHGLRDTALFPGYEVAGLIESFGAEVETDEFVVGDRVIIYPYEGIPDGYAEFMVVHDLKYVIKVPSTIPLSVAAMLPTGALLAKNTVFIAHEHVQKFVQNRDKNEKCKILIVGTGGLALWAMRIASHHFSKSQNQVQITVASLRDEGFLLAKEYKKVNVVQWNEECYEAQLVERTMHACDGFVDIVIDFGTTSRSLNRSLQCLRKGGVVFMSSEVADRLMPKFSRKADENEQILKSVAVGSIEQLKELVSLVESGEIEPPPFTVFPAEEAGDVVKKLCHSQIQGRAILKFHDVE